MKKKIWSGILGIWLLVFCLAPVNLYAYSAHSQSEAVAWAQGQLGKSLDYDGVYGAQCVDLICYYYQYLGTASPGGNAEAYRYNNLPNGWVRVYGNYQPGDIAVWKPSYQYGAYSTSQYGHVGIITSADSSGFNAVNQNFSNKSYCTQNWFPLQVLACAIRPDWGSASSGAVAYANVRTNWVDTWNAGIAGDIQNPNRATVAQVGAYVWNSQGTCVVNHTENCGRNDKVVYQTLNIVSEARPSGLQSGETYTFQFWAKVNGQYYFSNKGSFTIKDTTKPTITNVKISDISADGYTVTCTATDNFKVDRVQFPTWTTANGQDDLVADWWSNAKCRGTKSGNTYKFVVKRSEHKGEYGTYRTHIYAYDKAGNYVCVPVNDVQVQKKTYTVPKMKKPAVSRKNYVSACVKWENITNAVKYRLYMSTSGNSGYKQVAVTNKTSYLQKNMKPNTIYYFKVQAYDKNNKIVKQMSSATSVNMKIENVVGAKIKTTKKTATLQWTKKANVSGYRIYRSVNKKTGYKLVKTLNKNTTNYIDKKVSRKRTYYYKIVPIVRFSGKTYVGNSVLVNGKIK